ncbi:hypothetical protein C9374_010182 [Naegleria lovaniensis]|uniref:Uncharacterized protein n=1 Tax=Naegleria lovaniensis TaxID=51637 RepID=A0AA88GHV0_NAELO|nr:uncharacterized protein C9374_010182 [Naegleria lovaniensis]KAG2375178.1 hypothetical protein C9374_010182 [Naegleria lovaniensis]
MIDYHQRNSVLSTATKDIEHHHDQDKTEEELVDSIPNVQTDSILTSNHHNSSSSFENKLKTFLKESVLDHLIALRRFIKTHANTRSILLLLANIIITWIFQFIWSRLFISNVYTMLSNSIKGFDSSLGVEFLQHIGTRGRYLHLLYELIDLFYFIPSVAVFLSCLMEKLFSQLQQHHNNNNSHSSLNNHNNNSNPNIVDKIQSIIGNAACWLPSIYMLFGVLEHLSSISAMFHYEFHSPMSTTLFYLSRASVWCQYKWISLAVLIVLMIGGRMIYLACCCCCSCDDFELSGGSTHYYHDIRVVDEEEDDERSNDDEDDDV